jgi:hypothetical protein
MPAFARAQCKKANSVLEAHLGEDTWLKHCGRNFVLPPDLAQLRQQDQIDGTRDGARNSAQSLRTVLGSIATNPTGALQPRQAGLAIQVMMKPSW